MAVFIGGIGATSKKTNLSKLQGGEIFRMPNSSVKYEYLGAVYRYNQYGEIQKIEAFIYAPIEDRNADIYTQKDLEVILLEIPDWVKSYDGMRYISKKKKTAPKKTTVTRKKR